MQSAKDFALEVLDSLPEDCTLDDISYRLYLRHKLDQSVQRIEEGRVHSHEEDRRRSSKVGLKSSGPTQP